MSKIRFIRKEDLPAQKKGVSIEDILRDNLAKPTLKRGYEFIHASDLTKSDYCPRKVVLWREHGGKRKYEKINATLAMTFKMGNAVADLITNDLGGDSVWGHWKCAHCQTVKEYTFKPEPCGCDPDAWWKYKEIQFIHTDSGASGSVDAFFDLRDGKFTVTELKIISPDEFESLKMPLWEHSVRTKLYLEIIANSNDLHISKIDLSKAKVFYTCRTHGKKVNGRITPFKEFEVERDPGKVQVYLNKARQIKIWEDTGEYPAPICPNLQCKEAEACDFVKQCAELGGFAI